MNMNTITCEVCGGVVELDKELDIGELVFCEACGAEYEILNNDPWDIALLEEEK